MPPKHRVYVNMAVSSTLLAETPTTMISWRGVPIDLMLAINGYDERFNALYDTPDILVPLSRIPRYNGHTAQHYSVLTHTIAGYMAMKQRNEVHDACGAFLIHDFHEAFLGDITYPMQNLLDTLGEKFGVSHNTFNAIINTAKTAIDRCIANKYKIPLYNHTKIVSQLDVEIRVAERNIFLHDQISRNGTPEKVLYRCVHEAQQMLEHQQFKFVVDALHSHNL